MNFIEAVSAAVLGFAVRRKSWDPDSFVSISPDGVMLTSKPNLLTSEDGVIGDDWVLHAPPLFETGTRYVERVGGEVIGRTVYSQEMTFVWCHPTEK